MKRFSLQGLPVIDGATRDQLDDGCSTSVCRFLKFHPYVHGILWATACGGRSASSRNTAGQYDRIVPRPERTTSATGGLR